MPTFGDALAFICNLIIENASETRGKERPKTTPERREDNTTYVPPFFDLVCVAHFKLAHQTFREESEKRDRLFEILLAALEEGASRKRCEPAYFEKVLDLCRDFTPASASVWFDNPDNLTGWHPLIERHIRRTAEAFHTEPVTS